MHSLLERQIKRHLGEEALSDDCKDFIEAVDAAYHQADEDRQLLERSLELTSQELVERNESLRAELSRREEAEAQLQQYAQRQAAIAQLGQSALERTDDLQVLMEEATEHVCTHLDASYCVILEYLPGRSRLRILAEAGEEKGLPESGFVEVDPRSPVELALRTNEPVVVRDLQTDARFDSEGPLLREAEMTSGIDVVIEGEDEAWGVVRAYATQQRDFSSDDVDFLQSVANVLAQSIEQKRAKTLLRKSEARLRGLTNSVPGVIFQFYARPDGEYGLHFVGEQSRVVLGLDPAPEDFFERFVDCIPSSHREAVLASIDEAVERVEPWSFEMPFVKPGGDTIWVHGISTPEEREDEVVFNGVILDITERKQLEKQLRQAQKMETVGTLAGGIAHDFNNILHATKAYLELLEEGIPESDPDRTILDQAFVGLDRAGSLVDKLLTFSRQEGKTVEERVDVAEVVEDTIELARPSVPPNVQLRAETPESCYVLGDPDQLQQVAMNLVTNAAQAVADTTEKAEHANDGVLDIAVCSMRVDRDLARQYLHLEPGRYVRFTVSDSGPGMDADTQERIFEPFFTTKEVGKGTGLGLSVVHGIVQAHDGAVTVFTEPDEGTTFHVYLPAAEEGKDVPTAQPPALDGSAGRILFVDDDEGVRDLEQERLGVLGYEVTVADRAEAALQVLEREPEAYDLVITDFLMPEMNGLELVRALRRRGHALPVLVMSGFSARVSRQDVLEAGAANFLRKPVGSREMEETLEAIL